MNMFGLIEGNSEHAGLLRSFKRKSIAMRFYAKIYVYKMRKL